MAEQQPATPAPVSTESVTADVAADVGGVCCATARRRLDDEGIVLALTESKDGILAGPRQRLTEEITSVIRDAREGLIRELLFKEAVDYLHEQLARFNERETTEGGVDPTGEDHARQRTIEDERLNEVWHEGDLEEFKEELRRWLKSQVRLLYNNSRSCGAARESNGGLEEHSAVEQPALM